MAIFDAHHPLVFTFGILGNIISLFVYFAPLPTFIQICRKKSTLGFQSIPYVVALFSAMLWMYYAFLKSDAILLISINSLGCIIETIYIVLYLVYATSEARKHTAKLIASLNVGFFSLILLLTLFLFQGSKRVLVVGWVGVAISVCVFAAPLSIVLKVVRTRSVEFMPFTLSFFLTLSAIMWFAYGLLKRDLFVALPNVIGFFLGVIQMVLYGMYRNSKALVKEIKLPEHIINVVMLGASEVHPVDAQTSGSDNDHKSSCSVEEDQQYDQRTAGEEEHEKSVGCAVPADEPSSNLANVKIDTPVLITCAA